MKFRFLILLLIAGLYSSAQLINYPNYTNINSGYHWYRGAFDQLSIPAGKAPALATGQYPGSGAIYVDTVGGGIGLWVYILGQWKHYVDSAMVVSMIGTSGYTTNQTDSLLYSITPRMSLGPSLISIPVFVGVNPYTGEDVYADSLLLENDQAIGVDKYYGFSSSGIRMYNNTSDLKFGWGDNIMNQNRSVTQNGYSFSFLGSTNTIRFRPDGAVQMGNAGTMIPDRTNGITDFAHWLYDTAGSSVRAERYYFTSVSPQPVGDTLRTKANVSYIWSPQGDMLALKAQTALRIQSPYVSFDQSTIMNIGGSAPLIFSGCCAGALTPLIDVHMDDSAKTAALGSYGARAKWSGRKQGYAQQDFGYIDFVGTDSSTAASKARFDVYVNHNNTPTKRFSVDNSGTVSINKWSIPGDRALIIHSDNTVDTVAMGSGGAGVTDGDKGDITVSGSGSTYTVDNNAITDAKLRQSAGLSVVGNSSNSTGNVADITAGSDGNVLRRSGTAVGFGAINLTSSNAVTGTLPDANISSASTWNAKQAAISETDNNLTFSSNVLGTNKAVQTLTDGATITWDVSTGYNARVVLGGNRTLAITNPQQGDYYTITVVQDGTGSRTLTLPGGGSAPLNSAANDSITLTAYYRNSAYEWRGGAVNLASTSEVTGDLPYSNLAQVGANTVLANPSTSTADVSTVALSASQLLGRGSTGNVTAITPGTNLSMSGTNLNVTAAGSNTQIQFNSSGSLGGSSSMTWSGTRLSPNYVTLAAGTTGAGTSPLKFTSGTSMTSAEAGAMEFTTDDLFFTITTGTARKRILMADGSGGLTTNRVPTVTTNGRLTDNPALTFSGATLAVGEAGVTSGKYNISGATSGTVTIQTAVAAGTYNFNLPTSAGTSGQALISGGGGSNPITYLDVASGSYTPTVTGLLNVSSTSSPHCKYTRIGNQVVISGSVTVVPTAGTTNTSISITLPAGLTSTFSVSNDCIGTAAAQQNTTFNTGIMSAGSNEINVQFPSVNTSGHVVRFTGTYTIQ